MQRKTLLVVLGSVGVLLIAVWGLVSLRSSDVTDVPVSAPPAQGEKPAATGAPQIAETPVSSQQNGQSEKAVTLHVEFSDALSITGSERLAKVAAVFNAIPDARNDNASQVPSFPFNYGVADLFVSPDGSQLASVWRGQVAFYDPDMREWSSVKINEPGLLYVNWLDNSHVVYTQMRGSFATIFDIETGTRKQYLPPAKVELGPRDSVVAVVPVGGNGMFLVHVRPNKSSNNDRLYLCSDKEVVDGNVLPPNGENLVLKVNRISSSADRMRTLVSVSKTKMSDNGPVFVGHPDFLLLKSGAGGGLEKTAVEFPSTYELDQIESCVLSGDGVYVVFTYPASPENPVLREVFSLDLSSGQVKQLTTGGGFSAAMGKDGSLFFVGGVKKAREAGLFLLPKAQ